MSLYTRLLTLFHTPLVFLIAAVRRVERFLGPDDDWVEDDRRIVYEAADAVLRPLGGYAVSEAHTGDYIGLYDGTSDELEKQLDERGYQRNLLSARKYRQYHGHKQWATVSYVYDHPETDWQHHVYAFERLGEYTDVYGHLETSVRDPSGHITDEQVRGDPLNMLRDIPVVSAKSLISKHIKGQKT